MNTINIQNIKNRFKIIGNSDSLNKLIDIAIKIAPTDISVLITGENGSGKEIFAHMIHSLSLRRHNSFIAVNCGAIPEGTIDSELFGHVKGSFTNASEDRKGYFESVNKGTIFLDEVGELPLSTQIRLLRILESGEYIRVGSSKTYKTDVRVISATNINIDESLRNGKIREDLYYRLGAIKIDIPPLRMRKYDIKLIFKYFLELFSDKYKIEYPYLSDDAILLLEKYDWPGNIRQLKNIAEQIIILERCKYINSKIISKYIPNNKMQLTLQTNNSYNNNILEKEFLYKILIDMKKDFNDLKNLVFNMLKHPKISKNIHLFDFLALKYLNSHNTKEEKNNKQKILINEKNSFPEKNKLILSLAEQEIELIKKTLKKYNGKRKVAANELGISERTLYRKIKHFKI